MIISICSWADFNPRKDLKHVPWIRVEKTLPGSRKLFGLRPEQKWLWVCLLALGAEQNKGGHVEVDLEYLAFYSGLETDSIVQALSHFVRTKLITSDGPIGSDRIRTDTEQTRSDTVRIPDESDRLIEVNVPNERTNETNGTSSSCPTSSADDDGSPQDGMRPADLVRVWNEHRGPLSKARMTDKRRDKITSRLQEEADETYWVDVVTRLGRSPIATGAIKSDRYPNGWRADLDWLIANDTNHVKVAEGKYDDRKPENPARGGYVTLGFEEAL